MLKRPQAEEGLMYGTTRIDCGYEEDKDYKKEGTAFFFNLDYNDGESISFLVTTKHTVEDTDNSRIHLHLAEEVGGQRVLSRESLPVIFDHRQIQWRHHPDLDLSMLLFHDIESSEEWSGLDFYRLGTSPQFIPDKHELDELLPAEDVIMCGYPNGVWDDINNLPLFRKGICASHPAVDYRDGPEFLVDIICNTGSSGSPVFIYNKGPYWMKRGGRIVQQSDTRFLFMGVFRSGSVLDAAGDIVENGEDGDQSAPFAHIGYVIRSGEVEEFAKEIVEELRRRSTLNSYVEHYR